MDFYGVGAMSMEMSAVQTQYAAAVSIMKKCLDMPGMVMDTLLEDFSAVEVALTGLGKYIDMRV